MLRFVLYFGLAAPSNDEQRRNTKRVVERGQRIHHVTESGVLTHGHRFPPGEKRSERDPDCLAFACCAYVIQRRITDHVVDKRGKKGARYSGILRITKATQLIDERESADHDFKTPAYAEVRTLGLARDPRGRPRPAIVP